MPRWQPLEAAAGWRVRSAAPPLDPPPSSITHGSDIRAAAGANVGLRTATTRTHGGGRAIDAQWFADNSFPGTGTIGDPYVIDRVLFTNKLILGGGSGGTEIVNKYVTISNCRMYGDPSSPTPDNSRALLVENDGPLVTLIDSTLGPNAVKLPSGGPPFPPGGLDRTASFARPFIMSRCDAWGGNVAVSLETEQGEGQSIIEECWLHDTWSQGGDHTDLVNGNQHASDVIVRRCWLDGVRTGGIFVVNGIGIYNDIAGSPVATINGWTIQSCYIEHCQEIIIGSVSTGSPGFQDPFIFADNIIGEFSNILSAVRTPSSQSNNRRADGTPVTL